MPAHQLHLICSWLVGKADYQDPKINNKTFKVYTGSRLIIIYHQSAVINHQINFISVLYTGSLH